MSIPGFRKGYCTGVDKSSRFLEGSLYQGRWVFLISGKVRDWGKRVFQISGKVIVPG